MHITWDIEKYIDQEAISERRKDHLSVLCYTRDCKIEKMWDDVTLSTRSLVINNKTNKILGHCIPTFFNYQEVDPDCIPTLPYKVYEKADGSLINVFYDDVTNSWRCVSKSSFDSGQAVWAQEILNERDQSKLDKRYNYICELIHPENRIVVDYNNQKTLKFLTSFEVESGVECIENKPEIFDSVQTFDYTIEQILELNKTEKGYSSEGFVVRWDNGFRLKFKHIDYTFLHKIVTSDISPRAIWKKLLNNELDEEFVMMLPKHVRDEVENIILDIGRERSRIFQYCKQVFHTYYLDGITQKEFANKIFCVQNIDPKCRHIIMAMFAGKPYEVIRKMIFKVIEP